MTGKAWLVFLGAAVVLGFAHRWLWLLVWLAVWAVMYGWSIRYKPKVPCWKCHGSGISGHRHLPWNRAFGDCPVCHGKKAFVRLGVRVLQPERARQLAAR